MKITEYEKKLIEYKESRKEIKKAADSAWKEIQSFSKKESDRREKEALEENEAPCSVCGGVRYVLKYRDVVGSVEGEIDGSFSLFGGSISGYIDGETHTNPILSCRECGNEKKVIIAKFYADYETLEDNMPSVFYASRGRSTPWIREKGIEVARELGKQLFLPAGHKDIRDKERFTDEALLEGCRMEYKYPRKPKKPLFYKTRKFFLENIRFLNV